MSYMIMFVERLCELQGVTQLTFYIFFSVIKVLDICIKFVRPKVLSPSGVNVLVYFLMLVFQCFEEN